MWEISNIGQGTAFLNSLLLGGILCLLYDIFRLDRMIFKRSAFAVAVEDIIFWLISAFLTFCLLLLTTNGQIRAFVLFGMILGFIAYRVTLSRILVFLSPTLKKWTVFLKEKYGKFMNLISKTDVIVVKKSKDYLKRLFNLKKTVKK